MNDSIIILVVLVVVGVGSAVVFIVWRTRYIPLRRKDSTPMETRVVRMDEPPRPGR